MNIKELRRTSYLKHILEEWNVFFQRFPFDQRLSWG